MEFWVRSQNKMAFKKINDLSISQNLLTDKYTIFCDNHVFGNYATKERALEVLNEIQDNLIMTHTTNIAGYNNTVFYSMPEK